MFTSTALQGLGKGVIDLSPTTQKRLTLALVLVSLSLSIGHGGLCGLSELKMHMDESIGDVHC